MEFVAERKYYSVAELYKKFSCYFPTIVIVNVGFCGEEDGDCFDRGQILRIQTVSKQQRVLARLEVMKEQKDYSIPLNYQEPMSVVDRYGNVGDTQPLYKIMQRNMALPITVQFPRNRTITVGRTTISTNQIPRMRLVDVFDEVYLLGNYISNDGEVFTDVVQVPLYLSDFRLSIVKGIRGRPVKYWLSFVKKLNYKCSSVHYDVKFGNPDIAVYRNGAFKAKKEYACVEPIHYVNLVELCGKPCVDDPEQLAKDDAEANIYEPVNYTSTFSQDHDKLSVSKLKSKLQSTCNMDKKEDSDFNTVPNKELPRRLQDELKTELRRFFKQKSNDKKTETKRPPVAPKPVRPKDISLSNVGEQLYKNVGDSVLMSHLELKVSDHQEKIKYEPAPKEVKTPVNVPLMYVHPQHKCKTIEEKELQVEDVDPVYENLTLSGNSSNICSSAVIEPQLPSTVVHNTALQTGNKTIDISKLSICELGHYMKLLKLDKYVEVFSENMVDGSTLLDLTADVLREEFTLSRFQAIRLMKFAKEGHLPS